MDRGTDFLKSQINNAVMQHQTFLQNLEDHEGQAEDQRFRDLCSKHIPAMREHQRMLEAYQQQIGAELGIGRDLADAARESDFLRLVGDIVTGRQAQDTAFTFREAGRTLGNDQLSTLGETLERHHAEYVREANDLVVLMFVDHVRGTVPSKGMAASDHSSATL